MKALKPAPRRGDLIYKQRTKRLQLLSKSQKIRELFIQLNMVQSLFFGYLQGEPIHKNKVKTAKLLVAIALLLLGLTSCNKSEQQNNTEQTHTETTTETTFNPFNADSAYFFVEHQVAFGPRVPNTPEHKACAQWIAQQMEAYGATVQLQNFSAQAYTGETLNLTNIIASYNPEAQERVLLMAHWDTRPWADEDPSPANRKKPILGADDAGSGVAVMMEIGRYLGQNAPNKGVDLVFFDGEDYGQSSNEESWCLGSTHWSKHPHREGYRASYGILLDMVGSKTAQFRWEGLSKKQAPHILALVWDEAARLGYANYFVQADGAFLTDDHVPVIRNLSIPCIDIVNYNPESAKGFGDYWHTVADDMSHISKKTLQAVGHTVLSVINK